MDKDLTQGYSNYNGYKTVNGKESCTTGLKEVDTKQFSIRVTKP